MLLMGRQRGVTLVELMIGVTITSIVLFAGIPAFNGWMQNSQDRTAAESILNGLQLARVEAVKRSAIVRFDLTDDSGLVAWNVGCVNVTVDCPATIQQRVAAEAAANARAGVSTTAIPIPAPAGHFNVPISAGTGLGNGVSFNAMGRVPSTNIGIDVTRIDVTNAAVSGARRYVIVVEPGGQIRMCDPSLNFSTNPQGCS